MNSLLFLLLLFAIFGVYGALTDRPAPKAVRPIPRPGDEDRRRQRVRQLLLRLSHARRRSENGATWPF